MAAGTGIDHHTRNAFKLMANGDLHVFVEGPTGVLQDYIIPKGTTKQLGTDANGNFVLQDPTLLSPKAGVIALAAIDAGTKKVTFKQAFPNITPGVTYVIEIHFNGLAMAFNVTAQTLTDFTFTYLSTFVGNAYWTATVVTG